MSKYTTGELAQQCGVSVRTVQFYDAKGLLPPTELTEGGRRMYTENDLKKLQMICLLKSFGLSLDSIKGVLQSPQPVKILIILLEEQSKIIESEMLENRQKQQRIQLVLDSIRQSDKLPVNSLHDIERMMSEKGKLKRVYAIMLTVGILLDIIEIGTLFIWIFMGNWLPFAIGMPIVFLTASLLVRMYYHNTAYICPNCNSVFRPAFWNFFWARHTLKTRKLKCTNCGYHGYCVETFSKEKP